jgi:hypothetical protein
MDVPSTPKKRFSVRLGEFWADYWPITVSAISGISLTIAGTLIGLRIDKTASLLEMSRTKWGVLFIISAIGFIIGNIFAALQTKRITQLEEKIETHHATISNLESDLDRMQLVYRDLFDGQLAMLANRFSFHDTERISVYKHDGKAFVMLGRYSKNPEYRKPGRVMYPEGEGCIGFAWQNGEAFIDDLPDCGTQKNAYLDKVCGEWNIKRAVVRKMKMKSRSYAAYAIYDIKGFTRVAVIVFESMRVHVFNRDELRVILTTTEGKRISQFLDTAQSILPTPTYAHEEGY